VFKVIVQGALQGSGLIGNIFNRTRLETTFVEFAHGCFQQFIAYAPLWHVNDGLARKKRVSAIGRVVYRPAVAEALK
ncbi:MAG TPA: hypothetical protein VHY09_09745, partial [Candidatus Methylacidiphilales bacterium]|nr:hypothetical protein [Candidatus Methylacidiphilales bacterium]